jgi:chaperonin GroES
MFKPLGDRVLVKRWPEVEIHESGLILPAAARELPQIGRVVAIGNGPNVDVEVGDDVIFEKFAKNDCAVTIDDVDYLLLPCFMLYAVIVGGVNGIVI